MIEVPALMLSAGARLPLALLLVFGSAKLLAEAGERCRIPSIVGEIAAGVLLGPSVLGWIAPDETLSTLAELGAMFLLFRVRLEVKASELMRVGGTATVVAASGVVLPLLLGWSLMLLWRAAQVEALFLGAAMVATSVGITAHVLASRGLLAERASKVILAAAVIDDVLGLLVLAVVSSLARGRLNLAEILLTTVLALAFTVAMAVWGPKVTGRFVPHVQRGAQLVEAEFALALVMLFSLSLLAVYIGVAAIVGAFLAGMALSEHVEPRVHHLTHGVSELLVPFFLAGIGLHVNLRLLSAPRVWALAGLVLALALFSKFAGCGLAAWRLGRTDALRIGVGMMPRGEVGMVVAQLGLALGAIHQETYLVVVSMAVATTVLAPPLLGLAFRAGPSGQTGIADRPRRISDGPLPALHP
ncbi:MAG: cation:proton antiporter [Bryobacteraceae bacterium]